jgi:hypothetical protein
MRASTDKQQTFLPNEKRNLNKVVTGDFSENETKGKIEKKV